MTPRDTFLYAIAKHLENLVVLQAMQLAAEFPDASLATEAVLIDTKATSARVAIALRNIGEL